MEIKTDKNLKQFVARFIYIYYIYLCLIVLIAIKARTIYVKSTSEITANPTCCSSNLENRIASKEII